jgi:hypothetical protein
MPVVKIDPTDEFPVPFSTDADTLSTFLDEMIVAGNTASLLEELGAVPEIGMEDLAREKTLIESVVKKQDKAPLKNLSTALAASAFIKAYGHNLAYDVMEVRAALTNKLLEIANCGETKHELKALELLGKHSDIGLFTERSEITVNYKDPESLENAIKERVKRLLNADVIDVVPLGRDLDEELSAFQPQYSSEDGEDDGDDGEDSGV